MKGEETLHPTSPIAIKGVSVTLPSESTLETIASQLQPHTNRFLYVMDGYVLRWFDSLDDVPVGKRILEPSTSSGPGKEYYIRDTVTKELWCCFDERLRNRLLGMEITEVRLPVIASFIPVPSYSPIGSPINRSIGTSPQIWSPMLGRPRLGDNPQRCVEDKKKTFASNQTPSNKKVIDMSSSIDAAAPIIKVERI